MYLPHSHFYLGHAVGCDDYRDEIRKYIDSELHEMKEAMKSLRKAIDSSVQASRNPASSNKGLMLADYPSCGEISMEQFSGPLSCSPSTTHMPAFGQLIRDTPAQKLTHPTPQFVQPSFLQQTPKQELFLPSYSPLHTVPQTIDARCDKSAFHQPLTSQCSTEQMNWFNSVSPEEFMSADAVLARVSMLQKYERCWPSGDSTG